MNSREQIVNEIGFLAPRARAERLITLGDPERANPWAGVGKKLAAAQQRLRDHDESEAAETYARSLREYENAVQNALVDRATPIRELERAVQRIDRPLISRWEHFHAGTDVRGHMERLLRLAENPEAELEFDGEIIPFSADDIRSVAAARKVEGELRAALLEDSSAKSVVGAILAAHPEFGDLNVEAQSPAVPA